MEHVNVEQSRDDVAIFIEERLQKMTPFVPECSIHRVPKQLFNMNPSAYVPKEITIGPFHHDKKNFKIREELKLRFFNSYRCRCLELNVQNIVEKARVWESEARLYYSEPVNMDSDEFVKMMVLDGCFIVEFLLLEFTNTFPENENKVHPSFYKTIDVNIDLIMLENQLPFFVLQRLYDLISPKSNDNYDIMSFEKVVETFLNNSVVPLNRTVKLSRHILDIQQPRHLLDFLSLYFVREEKKNVQKEENQLIKASPSATQLREAGVKFKKVESQIFMDISFNDGTLCIPQIIIYDHFETCARNLLAFAQFQCAENCENFKNNTIDYFWFLDELISTEKDVNLLVNEEIIVNSIGGNDREISELFNNICKNTIFPCDSDNNYFSDIAKELRQHCKRRRNKWMASLRHNYLNTPWTFISVMAAIFLILLTLLQTIFSIKSTYK